MFDYMRLAKVLALAGSDADGEALAALRKAKIMLQAENLSFTHIAEALAAKSGQSATEAKYLHQHLATLQGQNRSLQIRITQLERQLENLRSQREHGAFSPGGLKRSRAEIADAMRAIFDDPVASYISDREIARQTGLSPQTVGNWRRKLATEHRADARGVHNGRRRR